MTIGEDRRRRINYMVQEHASNVEYVLDIGSKRGSCSKWITWARKVDRLDIDAETKPDIVADLEKPLPIRDGQYDLVIAGDIIEHVYNSRILMEEIHRVLRPGGILIATAPNICSLKYRIAFVLGIVPSHAAEGDKTYPRRGHIRDFNFNEFRKLLLKHKFKIKDEVGSKWYLPKTWGDTIIICASKEGC